MLSNKIYKCDKCDYFSNQSNNLSRHKVRRHAKIIKDIVNYDTFNRQIKFNFTHNLIQTWDISNVLTMKELKIYIIMELGWKRNVFYFKNSTYNEIDFENCISKYIRNEFGISNNNGNFIGLSFIAYEHDDPNI